MKTGNTHKLVELAISHWMNAVGAGSLQPNQALCTGKIGSRKEPSVNEIRRITGLAWILTRASAETKQLPPDLLAAIQWRG